MDKRYGYNWDEAAIERLKTLWFDGWSAREIGKLFGVSRNSIIGRVHRSGWSGADRVQRFEASKGYRLPPEAVLPSPEPEKPPAKKRRRRPPAQLLKTEQPVSKQPPAPFTLSLLELGPRHCKWPSDGDVLPFTFCAQPREEGSSYCPKHHYRAHYKGTQADIDRTIKGYHFGKAAA